MTTNNYSAKNTSEENRKNSNNFLFFLLTITCIVILIVSFMAFLKIENNLHALLVLLAGTALNVFIFINGKHQVRK